MDHTYLPTIITITLLQRSFDVEMKIYEFKDKVEKVVSSLKGDQERDKIRQEKVKRWCWWGRGRGSVRSGRHKRMRGGWYLQSGTRSRWEIWRVSAGGGGSRQIWEQDFFTFRPPKNSSDLQFLLRLSPLTKGNSSLNNYRSQFISLRDLTSKSKYHKCGGTLKIFDLVN